MMFVLLNELKNRNAPSNSSGASLSINSATSVQQEPIALSGAKPAAAPYPKNEKRHSAVLVHRFPDICPEPVLVN